MNKKILIAIISLIFILTIAVFVVLWQKKIGTSTVVRNIENNNIVTQKIISSSEIAAKKASVISNDSDVKAIESELNTVNENDFNIDTLSDKNVGL